MSSTVLTPEQSPGDERSYRLLTLSNALQVLLIHDETTDKAAAGMDVHVGHFSDPDEAAGLAHFLEHMLFLGTEKYPDENAYQKYLSDHGGNSNAFTDMEHTNYYFDVTHDHLEGALDRFAQFFIAPLFTSTATDREMNAVHNENAKNLLNDMWRLFQLSKSTANPAHPFSKFGTGNLETLRDTPLAKGTNVRDLLLDFHARYYSANIMRLCILGRESLDTLQGWAEEKFSTVVNKQVERPVFGVDAFVPSSYGMFKIVPIKDLRRLSIDWSAGPIMEMYKSKPWSVISHLAGHEGAGSILSLLKSKGWANGLSAGSGSNTTCFSSFTISIDLTIDGENHIDDILEIVYQYIQRMKEGDEATWTALFQEVKLVGDMNFRFQNKSSPINAVQRNANGMHKYAPMEVLTGPWLYVDFDYKTIQGFLDRLVPANMRVQMISRACQEHADQKEKWYQTEYSQSPLSEELSKRLTDIAECKELHLPAPNPFVPEDLKLKHDASDDDRKTPPTQIATVDTDGISVWWKPDKTFKMPKAAVKTKVISPFAAASPTEAVLTALYTHLLEDSLVEFAYDAEVAGLHYSVNSTALGLSVTLQGYNDKLSVLAGRVFDRMKTLDVKEERFQLMKEKLQRAYKNFDMEQPYQHAAYLGKSLVQETVWDVDAKLAIMDDVTPEALREHMGRLLRNLDVETLVHGNMTREDALALAMTLKNALGYRPLPLAQVPTARVVQLQPGNEYIHRVRTRNPTDKNSAVTTTFQCGEDSVHNHAVLAFMSHVANEPFFNELRTNEQLGYLVHSGQTSVDGVLFWRLILQSSDYDADYLDSRTEAFVHHWRPTLVGMSEEGFETNRNAVMASYLEKHKTLYHETARHWTELYLNRRQFDRKDQVVAELKELKLSDVVAFYDQHVQGGTSRRKLAVRYFGSGHGFIDNDGKQNSAVAPPEEKEEEQEEQDKDAKPKMADPPADSGSQQQVIADRGVFVRSMPLFRQLV